MRGAALAVAACAVLACLPGSAQAVDGGVVQTSAPSWAVSLQLKLSPAQQADYGAAWLQDCSGSVVGAGWVLTAAHCVTNAKTGGLISRSRFEVVIGSADLDQSSPGAEFALAGKPVVNPNYNGKNGASSPFDLALLPVKPLARDRSTTFTAAAAPLPVAGQSFFRDPNTVGQPTLWGYACGWSTPRPTSPCTQTKELRATPNDSMNFADCPAGFPSPTWVCVAQSGAAVQPGDAGGAWTVDYRGALVEVGAEKGSIAGGQYAVFSPPADHVINWIRSTARLPTPVPGHIWRTLQGDSWLIDGQGYRRPIPTDGDYECLVAGGATVDTVSPWLAQTAPPDASNPAACGGSGDIFVGVGNGQVDRYTPDGTLVATMDTGQASETTGMAFDSSGNLYVTNFAANVISKFDGSGNLVGTFGSGFDSDPMSIAFDSSGKAYVGQADDTGYVLEFDPSGSFIESFAPAPEDRGTAFVSLAPDDCTLYYTSESTSVKRYDVCKVMQLPDFADGLPGVFAYQNVPLPDGGMLVADTSAVLRLDSSGNIIQTYSRPEDGQYFGLALVPDGNSFWATDYRTGNVVHFDLASGDVLGAFATGTFYAGGVAVR